MPKKLADLLDEFDEEVSDQETAEVRDLIEAFGSRAFGPLLAAPALILLTPVGGIPLVPGVLAAFIVLISSQHLIGRSTPWLPARLADRGIDRERWDRARDRVRPWLRRVDRVVKPRLEWLAGPPMDHVISVLAVLLAVSMVPLGFIPFAVAVPAFAVLLLGVALSARDGLLVLLGLIAASVSAWLALGAIA